MNASASPQLKPVSGPLVDRRWLASDPWENCALGNPYPLMRLAVAAVAVALLLCGCACPQFGPQTLTKAYHPQNVFVGRSTLPPNIRRVALLPMACDQTTPEMVSGRDALEPIVHIELAKTHRFELYPVSSEALQDRTGGATWSCEDALPHDLFDWLSNSCGCDAVLFCRLTVFRGYAPLAVGWRMRLIDLHTQATLWAGDEVFDASLASVEAGARRFQLAGRLLCAPAPDQWLVVNSPRQFGQYAAAQLLGTLPGL